MSISTNVLGGPYRGFSARPTAFNQKDGEHSLERGVLRRAWNGAQTANSINGYTRVITPFRAVNNAGDYLGRVHYSCGGPNPTNASKPGYARKIGSMFKNCDATGVANSSCNGKFVYDSSDYVRFRKQQAMSRNYNDVTFVGDSGRGSYERSALSHVRH